MIWRLLIYIYLVFPNFYYSEGVIKWFTSSSDFSNENNWFNKVGPCSGRAVKFLKKIDFPVLIDKKISLKSIEVFNDVEIIFGKDSTIELSNRKNNSCDDHELDYSLFESRTKGYWWNPESWSCDSKRNRENCNLAVPDILRVPCLSDQVRFPSVNDSVYRIIFTHPVPSVQSLFIGEKNFSTSDFYDFTVSVEGAQRIIRESSPSTRLLAPLFVESEGLCENPTGCLCHRNTDTNQICQYMKKKCPKPSCKSPINMFGFCCKKCGAEISLSHNATLSIFNLKTLVKRVLEKEESKGIDAFCAKMNDDLYHVYFIPKDETVDYMDSVSLFSDLFSKDFNGDGKYVFQKKFATGTIAEKLKMANSESSKIAIITSLIIIILLVMFAVYLYRRKRVYDIPFMFRRLSFRRMSARSSRSVSIPSVHVASFVSSSGRSFINPAFVEDPERIQSFPSLPVLGEITTDQEEPEIKSDAQPNTSQNSQVEEAISFKALKEDIHLEERDANRSSDDKEKKQQAESSVSDASDAFEDNLLLIGEDILNEPSQAQEDQNDPLDMLAKSRVHKSGNLIDNDLQESD
ncbi:UNVERIFIED_CONTAM: hypothetical protein RMT77_002995 [Armadillidium vulgare]